MSCFLKRKIPTLETGEQRRSLMSNFFSETEIRFLMQLQNYPKSVVKLDFLLYILNLRAPRNKTLPRCNISKDDSTFLFLTF